MNARLPSSNIVYGIEMVIHFERRMASVCSEPEQHQRSFAVAISSEASTILCFKGSRDRKLVQSGNLE